MVKAIFFDVDGTLLPFNQKNIPRSTLNALTLLRRQGLKLFVATGRHPKMLQSIREEFEFDGYVTLNGQYAWTGNTVLHSQPLSKTIVADCINYMKENPFSSIFLEINAVYANEISDKVKLFSQVHEVDLPTVAPLEQALNQTIFQIVAFLNKEEEQALRNVVTSPDYARWSPLFVDIVPKGGSKEVGISALVQHFGFTSQDVMAFGDGDNDITMLQYANLGVAMGNGTQKLFDVADYITKSVEDNGIFHALEHFDLIE